MRLERSSIPRLLCYVTAFVLGMKQLREPDIWWQLLTGRWMLEHGQVTRTDMFSYTMTGHSWINVKWLYELLIGVMEKACGPGGVMLLQGMVNVTIVWLLFRCVKLLQERLQQGTGDAYTVIAALLFLITVEYRMAGRPEMMSHLLCAVYLFIIMRSSNGKVKDIIWLLPLQCLWANMHEGYPVGLVMIAVYKLGCFISYLATKDKSYLKQTFMAGAVLLCMILVVLLNPNGIVLWKQPFEIYRQVWANKYTTELYSYTNPEYWTLQAKINIVVLAGVIIYFLQRIMKEKKAGNHAFFTPQLMSYVLLIPVLGYLSLTANRNIPFVQIGMLPSLPLLFKWIMEITGITKKSFYAALQKRSVVISSAIAVALYLCVVSNVFYKATASENRYGIHVNLLHNPTGAVDFIQQQHITGTAFSDYFISSYLLWDMYPHFKSYIDLRDLDVFPVSFFDEYFKMYERPALFHDKDSQYHFNYVVLSTSQLPGLQTELYWKEGYNMVYADPVSVIFLKQNEQNKAVNDNLQIQKLFSWPQAQDEPGWSNALNHIFNPLLAYKEEDEVNMPVYAAMFYKNVRNYPLAIKMLLPQVENVDDQKKAYVVLADCYNEYAKVTKEPGLKQARADSAQTYLEMAGK